MSSQFYLEDSSLTLVRSPTGQTAVTASTNSTASDIPGPGRTVDAFLSAAGRGLERFLARAAEQWSGGPNVLVARMLLLQAGRPSCLCQEGTADPSRSGAALDPISVLRVFVQSSTWRCGVCSRSYPDILMQHSPFLQDCTRLVDWIRYPHSVPRYLVVSPIFKVSKSFLPMPSNSAHPSSRGIRHEDSFFVSDARPFRHHCGGPATTQRPGQAKQA